MWDVEPHGREVEKTGVARAIWVAIYHVVFIVITRGSCDQKGGQRSIHVLTPGLAVRHIREGGMRAEPIVGVTIRHVQNFALARRGMLAQYCPPVQPDCAEQQSLAL